MHPESSQSSVKTEGTVVSGGETLFTLDVRPVTPPRARVIFLHGYGDHCGRYAHLYAALANHGVSSAAFDFRGQGRSSGPAGFVRRWEDYLDDLDRFLAARASGAGLPTFVVAHSHGSLVAVRAALDGRLPTARGLVICSAYLGSAVLVPQWKRALSVVANILCPSLRVSTGLADGQMTSDAAMMHEAAVDPHIRRVATPRWFAGVRVAQRDALARAPQFKHPLLALHGDADRVSDLAIVRQFVEASGATDKSLVVCPAGKHELLRETFRAEAVDRIVRWIEDRMTEPRPAD